jgi:hypothetical protein
VLTPDQLAEIEQRRNPGAALALNQLIAAATTTHPHTGDEPVVIQGCVVRSAKTLRETVRKVWFEDVPALLAEVKRLTALRENAEQQLRYLADLARTADHETAEAYTVHDSITDLITACTRGGEGQ